MSNQEVVWPQCVCLSTIQTVSQWQLKSYQFSLSATHTISQLVNQSNSSSVNLLTSPLINQRDCESARHEARVSRHKDLVLSFRLPVSRFERQGFYVKLFLFSKKTMLHSHVAVHKCAPSISACGALFCNCLNCQLQQEFIKCKSILIFSVSKIYPSQMNGAA